MDLTDCFYYCFKGMEPSFARLAVQLGFVLVWVARRIVVFGQGDWGRYAYKVLYAKMVLGEYAFAASFGAMMGLLLFTNYYWTVEIVRVVGSRLVRMVPVLFK